MARRHSCVTAGAPRQLRVLRVGWPSRLYPLRLVARSAAGYVLPGQSGWMGSVGRRRTGATREGDHQVAGERDNGMAATKAAATAGVKAGNGRRAVPVNGTNGNGSNGKDGKSHDGKLVVDEAALQELLYALRAAKDGNFAVRLPARRTNLMGQIGAAFNELVEMNARATRELSRVGRQVGREGRMTERFALPEARGGWADQAASVNGLIEDLSRPTTEVARVIEAVAEGDLSQKMALKIEGQPVKGEFLRIGTAVNSMVDQLSSFSAEVSRVAREVGTEGILGGQAQVKGVSGTWK